VSASVPVEAGLGNGDLSIDTNSKLNATVGNGQLILAGVLPESEASVGNGKVRGDVQLNQGTHEITVGNGSVELALRSGTSLSYEAGTSMGNITLTDLPGKVEQAMMSKTASGSIGDGSATLDISVGNGGIKLSSTSAPAVAPPPVVPAPPKTATPETAPAPPAVPAPPAQG
jgi:DUF4097 and DUF4098 domain-containing protein YvlB